MIPDLVVTDLFPSSVCLISCPSLPSLYALEFLVSEHLKVGSFKSSVSYVPSVVVVYLACSAAKGAKPLTNRTHTVVRSC